MIKDFSGGGATIREGALIRRNTVHLVGQHFHIFRHILFSLITILTHYQIFRLVQIENLEMTK